jgi:hypothetical protein
MKGEIPLNEKIEFIRQFDPAVADAMAAELDRQRNGIELIASENFVSESSYNISTAEARERLHIRSVEVSHFRLPPLIIDLA